MTEVNEVELAKLDKLISELQWQIFHAGGINAASTSMLVKRLTEAQRRSATVHQEDEREREKKEQTEQQERSWIIARAERELALSQSEQREYASFLQCDFFTREMFPRLDQFYNRTWARLSEEGKAEMSKRVWEGVHQGQYRFNELPESVKDKEAERMHHYLTSENTRGTFERAIPQADRQDFCSAYEAGDKQRSYSVLEREGFAKAMHHVSVSELVSNDAKNFSDQQKKAVSAALANAGNSSQGKAVQAAQVADLQIDDDLVSELRTAQEGAAKKATDFRQEPTIRKR